MSTASLRRDHELIEKAIKVMEATIQLLNDGKQIPEPILLDLSYSMFDQVVGVRKFSNGGIEIDFYHEDQITEYRYSSDSSRLGTFPKELAETLASTLANNICTKIYFAEDGNPTHVELEECDDSLEDDEEFDEDLVSEES